MSNKIELEIRLNNEYNICIENLKKIEIDINKIGKIDLKIAAKNCKRYGCCKQENPVIESKYIEKIGKRRIIKYGIYEKHIIEISPWVFELNEEILRNTIIHEIIHCFPYCNNHGNEFKKYARYINLKLGYNITTRGNKEKDYLASNLKLDQENQFKYQITCVNCGYSFKRKRLNVDYEKKYRCGKCGGHLKMKEL